MKNTLPGLLIGFACFLLLMGCYNAPKHYMKSKQRVPLLHATTCHSDFPCVDSIRVSAPVYLPGETITKTDTVTAIVDNQVIRYVTTVKHVRDTIVKERVVYQSDKAEITACKLILASETDRGNTLQKDKDKVSKGRDTWRSIALGMILYFMIRIILRIYTKISLP